MADLSDFEKLCLQFKRKRGLGKLLQIRRYCEKDGKPKADYEARASIIGELRHRAPSPSKSYYMTNDLNVTRN